MNQIKYYLLILSVAVIGCSEKTDTAQSIVDQSIEAHGGELFENSIVDFDFRGRHYSLERNNGMYKYHRIFKDSSDVYHDILTNDNFRRLRNDQELSVSDDWARRYSNSINSVAYFTYLPFGLNDPAVIKGLIGEEEINGNYYHKIQVTFKQEGGGEDFDDVFVYWINKESFLMEFFGYSYISDGGGIRFREAFEMQEENGLVFSNYLNFKAVNDLKDVSGLAELFKNGELVKLSEIRIENLKVSRYK